MILSNKVPVLDIPAHFVLTNNSLKALIIEYRQNVSAFYAFVDSILFIATKCGDLTNVRILTKFISC